MSFYKVVAQSSTHESSGISSGSFGNYDSASSKQCNADSDAFTPGTLSLMMAVCFERILVSRRTNFLPTARYFANSSLALFKVGDEVEVRRVVSMKDVEAFARITGDTNPIHLDEKFAKKTRVGQLIVHGLILNGYCDVSMLIL